MIRFKSDYNASMALYLSHMTALDFWRVVYRIDRAPGAPESIVALGKASCPLSDIRPTLPSWIENQLAPREGGRIHALVKSAGDRSHAHDIQSHVWGSNLPMGAFYKYSDDLYISSPAFAYVQMAASCSPVQLVALADELCGRYSFDEQNERGIRVRKVPLTTVRDLQDFVQTASPFPGAERAMRALRYAVAGAESPMETTSHLLLSLPYRYGGYGISGLLFNHEITLTAKAAVIAQREKCRADIYSEKGLVDIEFAGKRDHVGPDALESDRRRMNALSDMGYEIIELTSGQVHDLKTFEHIAMRVAKRLGKRIEKRYRGALPARNDLRRTLFTWNAAYGRPGQ